VSMVNFAVQELAGSTVLVSESVLSRFAPREIKEAVRQHGRAPVRGRETKHRFPQTGTIFIVHTKAYDMPLVVTADDRRSLGIRGR